MKYEIQILSGLLLLLRNERMFAEIPKSIFVEILTGWCSLKWLVNFDSAVCNKLCREYLINIYSIKHFTLPKKFTLAQSNAAISWLSIRGIKLSELNFDGKHILKIDTKIDTSKVENLGIMKFNKGKLEPNDVVKLINQCPSMMSLRIDEVYCFHLDALRGINDNVWSKLTDLRVSNCSKFFNSSCVQYLSTKCHNLIKINLAFPGHFAREEDFIEILRNNPSLTQVTLQHSSRLTADIIDTVSQHLQNITYLKTDAYDIGPKALLNLISSCPKLRDVDLKGHVRYLLAPDPADGVVKKSLALCGFHDINFWELNPVLDEVKLKETEHIYTQITNCSNIFIRYELRDSILDTIVSNNPNLEQLTISYAGRSYTAGAIANLVRACPRLHTLEFASNHITHEDIVTIFTVPNNISCVSFFEHDEVDEDTLAYIVENVPTIKTVCVEMCELIYLPYMKSRFSNILGRKIKWESKLKKILPVTTLCFGR